MDNECTFSVDVTGDESGQQMFGDFTMRRVLPPKDLLKKDQLRREYLGNTSGSQPSGDALYLSEMLADLAAHLTKWPTWWKDQEFGANSEMNVLVTVYNSFLAKMEEWTKQKQARKEAQKESLRKQLKNETPAE